MKRFFCTASVFVAIPVVLWLLWRIKVPDPVADWASSYDHHRHFTALPLWAVMYSSFITIPLLVCFLWWNAASAICKALRGEK